MARGRMIARTLSTSQRYARLYETAGKLAEFCQALYPLLIAHADDFGRLAGDAFTVKHAVIPASPRKDADIEAALAALHAVNLVIWYEVDGRKCLQIVDFDAYQTGLHKRTTSKFPEPSGNFREIPSEEKGREQKRTEQKGTEGKAGAVALSAVPDGHASEPELSVQAVVQMWNAEIAAHSKLPVCRGVSDQRRKHIHARLKSHGLSEIRDVMLKARESTFCNGENDRRWVLTFDWLMDSEDHFLKVMEGKYDNRPKLQSTGTDGRGRTGAPPPGKYDRLED